jgi:hypothetical protein
MKTDYNTPEGKCLSCGHVVSAAFSADEDDNPPRGGNATICIQCGHAMIFNEDLTLREPTEEEKAEIDTDPIVREARGRLQRIRARLN